MSYNGYKNYATWLLALNITNIESVYRAGIEFVNEEQAPQNDLEKRAQAVVFTSMYINDMYDRPAISNRADEIDFVEIYGVLESL